EMSGLAEFPRIADVPYFLTLSPYASYWFTLQHEPMQMAPKVAVASDPNAVIAEGLPALLVGADWETVMDSATRTVLERQALAPFLQRQAWFNPSAMEIRRVRFSDWTRTRGGDHPAFISIVSVEGVDG